MTKTSIDTDLDHLSAAELRCLVIDLLGTVATLEGRVAELTEEIARLKGLKGRPKLTPSGLEKGTNTEEPSPSVSKPQCRRGRRQRSLPKSARLIIDEDRVVPLEVGSGWRFRGYKRYTVQELIVEVRVVRYWRPCYQAPDGQLVIAPLPPEVRGHFGPNLMRYLVSQHYQCRVTMPLLRQQLNDIGILISAGQISNLPEPRVSHGSKMQNGSLQRAFRAGSDDEGRFSRLQSLGEDRPWTANCAWSGCTA